MNSGLQDAFNLSWKLALVCHGHAAPALLDSYEAERRPVAEMITASGYAFEQAQYITDPEERRARDEELRAVFSNSKSRHHESIAEAEINVDYADSPIVMGDRHEALAPGHRLPDTIDVRHASGEACLLHELTRRAGHTALVLGGAANRVDELVQLADAVASSADAPLLEATIVVAAESAEPHPHARLTPAAAEQLSIGETTLLVIRPDGHVGLRADRDHLDALANYVATLTAVGGS